jgi:four helix bundle protein
MIGDDLRTRSRQFAIDVVALCIALGQSDVGRVVKSQLLRAATGTAANYRAACRSRSAREFASRLSVCVEEVDEAELWLDIIETTGLGPIETVQQLRSEATQLRAIFARSRTTVLENAARKKSGQSRKPRNAESGNRDVESA